MIRPVENGPWRPDNHIELTSFGKLVARHRGEALASAAASTDGATASAQRAS